EVFGELIHLKPAHRGDLVRVWLGLYVTSSHEHVVVLHFDTPARLVHEAVLGVSDGAEANVAQPKLLAEAAYGRGLHALPRRRVPAAGGSPLAGEPDLRRRSLLEQHPPLAVKEHDGEAPMEHARRPVRGLRRRLPDHATVLIDQLDHRLLT